MKFTALKETEMKLTIGDMIRNLGTVEKGSLIVVTSDGITPETGNQWREAIRNACGHDEFVLAVLARTSDVHLNPNFDQVANELTVQLLSARSRLKQLEQDLQFVKQMVLDQVLDPKLR